MFVAFDAQQQRLWAGTIEATGPFREDNRDAVVRQMLAVPSLQAVLFVDSHIGFDPRVVYVMVDALDPIERPIVTALAVGRAGSSTTGIENPLVPLWFTYDERTGFTNIGELQGGHEPVQIDGCGGAFVLIHRSAFERIPLLPDETLRWYGRMVGKVGGALALLSEDLSFCMRCLEYGIPIHGLPIKVDHYKMESLTVDKFIEQEKGAGRFEPTNLQLLDASGRRLKLN
jgi:hypothetical protein